MNIKQGSIILYDSNYGNYGLPKPKLGIVERVVEILYQYIDYQSITGNSYHECVGKYYGALYVFGNKEKIKHEQIIKVICE